MKKANNQGLSLIELLIAVCIMAILSIPIMHSFVSSYHINAKSRTSLRATTLAQNEMEIFEREKIEDLIDPNQYDYTVVEPNKEDPSDPGIYTYSRIGIINDDSGRSQFDVYVTLDPKRQSGERYDTKNNEELFELQSFSVIDGCRYVQSISTKSKKSEDDLIYREFAEDSKNAGTNHDEEYYKENLLREIVVDITKTDATMPDKVQVKVTREYTELLAGNRKNVKKKEQIIFNNSQSLDEEGNPIALKGVYLFYTPRYIAKKDVIRINNNDGVNTDIFVIRQDIYDDTYNAVAPVPNNYQPRIVIQDPLVDGNCSGIYHTNLNINEAPEAPSHPGKQVELRLNGDEANRAENILKLGLVKLDGTKKKDRIYDMTVKVYKTGADVNVDAPLITLTGTKLE